MFSMKVVQYLKEYINFDRISVRIKRCLILLLAVALILSANMQAVKAQPEMEDEGEVSEEIVSSLSDNTSLGKLPENLSVVLGEKENWPYLDDCRVATLNREEVPEPIEEPVEEENKTTIFSSSPLEVEKPAESNHPNIKDKSTVVVFCQTDMDFAKRDANGILRNADGSVADGAFVRYVGKDLDGQILFFADEAGNITYKDEPTLYFNANENRFYADKKQTVGLTGIKGVLDSSGLALDGESIITLLNMVDGTLATVEIPWENVLPKQYIDKKTGETLTEGQVKSGGIPKKRIRKKNPKGRTYLIWKSTKKDKKYAPAFAKYICSNEKGGILFYADKKGHIFYNVGNEAIYNEKYFFSLDQNGQAAGNEYSKNQLITDYKKMRLSRYPSAAEKVRFALDGKAFEVSLYDRREGAKGRYLCRNVTKELLSAKSKNTQAVKLDDPSVVWMMDEFGTMFYAVDDYIWQYVDPDINYELMAIQVADGTLKKLRGEYNDFGLIKDQEEEAEEEETSEEGTEEEILAAEEAARLAEEKALQEAEADAAQPEETAEVDSGADKLEGEKTNAQKPEKIDEVDGLTRNDFDDDESWEAFVKGDSGESSNSKANTEKEVDGLTRADFEDDESWEAFIKGE